MRASTKTLLEARRVGLQLVAVCHNMNCRKSQAVDLDSVISYVGAQHEMLPVLNVRHFSERMVCPHCNHRGMFVWPVVNDDAEPNLEDALFSIKEWEKGGKVTSICETTSFKVAIAAYAAALLENPNKHITLQERARVLRDSKIQEVG